MKPLAEWRESAQYFEAQGHRLAYWTSETGNAAKPWLLLIHGYPTSSWDWTGLWPTLERKFNIAALDMLGFGLSDKPKDIAYRLVDQASLQEALLERLSVEEAHLLVHDYGNSVAQELLARHNEGSLKFSIASLCFLNGGLFPEQHRPRPIQKFGLSPFGFLLGVLMNRRSFEKSFSEIFGADTQPSETELETHWALIGESSGRTIQHKLLRYIPERVANRSRWVGALMEARIPLRLIDGGADPVSGKHLYDYYRDTVPNADAVLFADIGHYPQTEAPEKVIEAFFNFHLKIGTGFP